MIICSSQMLDHIGRISYDDGNTNTSGGLFKMNEEVFITANGDRQNVDNIAIVITDGASTRDTHLLKPYATQAKDNGVKILAVGITENINFGELADMASEPIDADSPTVFNVTDFHGLEGILASLLRETCMTASVVRPTTTTTTSTQAPEDGEFPRHNKMDETRFASLQIAIYVDVSNGFYIHSSSASVLLNLGLAVIYGV